MRRLAWPLVLGLGLVLALPALAGSYGKCTLSTQECLDKMTASLKTSGFVGVEFDWKENSGETVVTNVFAQSPAESAGIQKGDILYALNGVVISEKNDAALQKARKEWKPGQQVTYTIRRNGTDREVSLTLAPMPADMMARIIGQHMMEHAVVNVSSEVSKN